MRPFRLTLTLVAAIALVIAVAACGSSGSSSSSSAAGGSSSGTSTSSSSGLSLAGLANTKPLPTQKMGGTLHLDLQRRLGTPGPRRVVLPDRLPGRVRDPDAAVHVHAEQPDQACSWRWPTGLPQISSDGKTVTIHIKSGWKWSPPLNRDITSKDVAYAFQRDFNPNVQNGYAAGYYPIVGSDKSAGKPISGISTPNNTTIVFHLTKNFGATFAEALTLPGSAPCPSRSPARMTRAARPSTTQSRPSRRSVVRT